MGCDIPGGDGICDCNADATRPVRGILSLARDCHPSIVYLQHASLDMKGRLFTNLEALNLKPHNAKLHTTDCKGAAGEGKSPRVCPDLVSEMSPHINNHQSTYWMYYVSRQNISGEGLILSVQPGGDLSIKRNFCITFFVTTELARIQAIQWVHEACCVMSVPN